MLLGPLACAALAACGRPHAALAPGQTVTIRLAALLPLHPAWQQVEQVDTLLAIGARVGQSGAPAVTASLPLSSAGLPSALSIAHARPVVPPSPTDVATAPARDRVAAIRRALEAGAKEELDRSRAALERRAAADIAARRAELIEQTAAAPPAAPPPNPQLLALQLKEIAYKSQVDVLFQPARGVAIQNLRQVREQIAALLAKQPRVAETPEDRVQKTLEAFRAQRMADVDTEVSRRRSALSQQIATTLAGYDATLTRPIPGPGTADVPALAASAHEPVAARLTPGTLVSPSALQASAMVPGASVAQQAGAARAALLAERARLVRYATDDVRRRVEDFAHIRRWRVLFSPPARVSAPDRTEEVAAELRAQLAVPAVP